MRILPILCSVIFISACSTTPRVGDISGADYPIEIKPSSSEALKQLKKVGITGVRDLSVEEFNEIKKDYDQFLSLNQESRGASNSTTYALASTAVGSGVGLSLGYAGGLALLGKLAADERPRNYNFADDYKSESLIYSPMGSEEFMEYLVKKIPVAMSRFEQKMKSSYSIKTPKKPYHASGVVEDKNYYTYAGITSVPKGSVKGSTLTQYVFTIYCKKAAFNSVCEVESKVKIGTNERPFVSLMIKELANSLPKNSLLYMNPRKDIYQLPSIYKAGGEHMLLVEAQ